jgi:hypothetical protein
MAQLRLLTTRSLHDVVVAKPTSARELIVIPAYLYPGSTPRLQVALRDPRHRLEGPVIPLQQRFVAEGRYILSHGPKATSVVTHGHGLPRTWAGIRVTGGLAPERYTCGLVLMGRRIRQTMRASCRDSAHPQARRRDGVGTSVASAERLPRASWRRQNLVRFSSPRAFRPRRGFGVRIKQRGTHRLKGLPRDWRLFALIG